MTPENIEIMKQVLRDVLTDVCVYERMERARLDERVCCLERENEMLKDIIRNLTTGGNKNDT